MKSEQITNLVPVVRTNSLPTGERESGIKSLLMKINNVKMYLLIVIVTMVIFNVKKYSCENLPKLILNFTNLLLFFVYIPASN